MFLLPISTTINADALKSTRFRVGSETFPVKILIIYILSFAGHMVQLHLLKPFVAPKEPKKYVNEWASLGFNKILFTKWTRGQIWSKRHYLSTSALVKSLLSCPLLPLQGSKSGTHICLLTSKFSTPSLGLQYGLDLVIT